MGGNWYKTSFRRNLVDMHIEDWDSQFMSEFDPQHYFDCLQKGQIQSPMIYIHSHVGLCNWDSKSGRTHRAFQGTNKIRKLFDLCHEAGMDVIAYYSLIYNNCAYEDHPEWRMRHPDGSGSRKDSEHEFMSGGRYGYLCPNQMGYREFLKEQFREFMDEYEMEGIFLDMTFWPIVCYCDACQSRFMAETGQPLPLTVDWKDEGWRRLQAARHRWIGEFASFCTKELKSLKPDVSIEHQFSTISHQWGYGVGYEVNEANDFAGGDLYGGFLQQSYICKSFREATNNQPFEYMTSRCDPGLKVHTTTKSLDDLRLHNFLTLAHHGAFLVIDGIDPVGTLNPMVYERIGQLFAESKPYEPFLTGDMLTEAALIMSYDSKFDLHADPAGPQAAARTHRQLSSQLGMARVLNEMRMLYTVLPNNRLDRLEGKKLAVLTDATILNDNEIDQLVDYVSNGGSLYVSGTTDYRLAGRLLGLAYNGYTAEANTYLAPTGLGETCFGDEYSRKYPLNYAGPQMMVENPQGHPVLATITLPYTNPADTAKFASIHSNPPGIATEYPAIISGRYGSGKVLWLAAGIEANQQISCRGITARLIKSLAQPERLVSNAPGHIEMTLFRDEAKRRYLLHLVNVTEEPGSHLAPPFEVRLKLEEAVHAVRQAPDLTPSPFVQTGDELVISIDGMNLFQSYVFEY
ncbi:MAG: hypothetical protein K0R57_238 [Paenibacillaceae bacterium]|nr:hypothetical protein [Paenibacillaceae bacterium]